MVVEVIGGGMSNVSTAAVVHAGAVVTTAALLVVDVGGKAVDIGGIGAAEAITATDVDGIAVVECAHVVVLAVGIGHR